MALQKVYLKPVLRILQKELKEKCTPEKFEEFKSKHQSFTFEYIPEDISGVIMEHRIRIIIDFLKDEGILPS